MRDPESGTRRGSFGADARRRRCHARGQPAGHDEAAGVGDSDSGQPGNYTVQPGDMLTKIGMDTGQSWRDLARWNNLTDPNRLEVGQVLRVVPPTGDVAARQHRHHHDHHRP